MNTRADILSKKDRVNTKKRQQKYHNAQKWTMKKKISYRSRNSSA